MAAKAFFAVAVILCCASAAVANYQCQEDGDCKSYKPCVYGKCSYGKCVYSNRPDGYTCHDGNPCTLDDKCYNGECKPGAPKQCVSKYQCKTSTCNKQTGNCDESYKPDGSSCDDGNPCTLDDKCYYGQCNPGAPKKCVSKYQCKTSTCNKQTGNCDESYKPDGSSCNDGNPCTLNDKCYYGQCNPGAPKKCVSKYQCKTSTCNKQTGNCDESYKPDGSRCNDGKKCTYNDKCYYGICKGTYKKCPTTKKCTKSYCNPITGQCKTENLPDGTPCDDGDCNTKKDKCTYGVCKGIPKYG